MSPSIDREQLRQLALAATPGPWEADQAQPWTSGMGPFDDWGASVTVNGTVVIQGGAQDEQGGAVGVLLNEDAEYIAAANPQVMLTLLTELDQCDQALAVAEQLNKNQLTEMAELINQLDQAVAEASRLRQALKDLVHIIMTGTIISLDGVAVYTIRHDSATLKIAHNIVLESQS